MKLMFELEDTLVNERFDSRKFALDQLRRIEKCPETELFDAPFNSFANYFQSRSTFEPSFLAPWQNVDFDAPRYDDAKSIEGHGHWETKQIVCWLIEEMKPQNIIEIGTLFGNTTALMAETLTLLLDQYEKPPKIFACDSFQWQASWMDVSVKSCTMPGRSSFLEFFEKNIDKYKNLIETVVWSITDQQNNGDQLVLPQKLESNKFELAFIDFTLAAKDLEAMWSLLHKNFVPFKSILVFNGVTRGSIDFFVAHKDELTPLAHCQGTISKTFLYTGVGNQSLAAKPNVWTKKLNFLPCPDWSHHHKNAFSSTIEQLKSKLHDPLGHTLFVPAVETWLCDTSDDEEIATPWIGIVHGVINDDDHFYVPDLERLCHSQDYSNILKNCRGLFTLTEFQADYLNQNWPTDVPKIPIQPVKYPMVPSIYKPTETLMARLQKRQLINFVLIGSFARNFDLFCQIKVPNWFQKVWLIGDDAAMLESNKTTVPSDILIMNRLNEDDYEELLHTSVVFLSLLQDGAANTVILECIARNCPIVCPALKSCTEYLGEAYPLFYDNLLSHNEIGDLLTKDQLSKAIRHLESMDKGQFSLENFISSILDGNVLLNVSPSNETSKPNFDPIPLFHQYDVTIALCIDKELDNLEQTLQQLWNKQTFNGTFEILIWNNNEASTALVKEICKPYLQKSTKQKALNLLSFTSDLFTSIYGYISALMQSQFLIILDEKFSPNSNFISFFHAAVKIYPNECLCTSGHVFSPHEFNDIESVSQQFKATVSFVGGMDPTQLVHMFQGDACLIPKKILHEYASQEMPDPEFTTVMDYWMSYVIHSVLKRKIRKLEVDAACPPIAGPLNFKSKLLPVENGPLFDVQLRFYMHHTLQGWPNWWPMKFRAHEKLDPREAQKLKLAKCQIWDKFFIGMNVMSRLAENDIQDLKSMSIRHVRIGSVAVGRKPSCEYFNLQNETEQEIEQLCKVVEKLAKNGISVIFSLPEELANPEIWRQMAAKFVKYENVIGYDLINEPFTKNEQLRDPHISEFSNQNDDTEGVLELIDRYANIVKAIREVDNVTPLIIQSSHCGNILALDKSPFENVLKLDSNMLISVHFYEPKLLTKRQLNGKRFTYPGQVPTGHPVNNGPISQWDKIRIDQMIKNAKEWSQKKNVKLFLGEFGITRTAEGATDYLSDIAQACIKYSVPAMLYSFRDRYYEGMNYEMGTGAQMSRRKLPPGEKNPLVKAIFEFLSLANNNL